MAPNFIIGEEASPSSPRMAALYYWGGGMADDGNKENNQVQHQLQSPQCRNGQGSEGDASPLDYTKSSPDGGASRTRYRRHRPLIKFHLEMDDEDDCNHWMFLRGAAPAAETRLIPKTAGITASTPSNSDNDCNGDDKDFKSIPIIDLNQPIETYSTRIGNACCSTGFFYIINHGIQQSVMDDVMDVSKRLFELDLKSKIGLNAVAGSISDDEKETKKKGYRGYFGIGEEDLDNKDGTRDLAYEEQTKTTSYSSSLKKTTMKGGDFKEGFDVGLDDTHQAFFGKNVWPDEEKHESIIGFRQTLLRYQNELLKLADKLMVAFAMSLNSVVCGDGAAATGRVVPMDYFLIRTRNPMCTLRLLHYPPSLSMSNSGCGAHTDYGLFTILQQDCIGGLQVRNKAKQWIDAKPLRGSFVINVGDMLSLWTSGAYASTVHRVISPSSSSGRHRYSVPFFFNPDHDALVETIVNVTSGKCNKERDIRCSKRVSRASEILFARYKGTFQSDDDD